MIEDLKAQERELKRGKIVSETARIPWKELQRHFAAGRALFVSTRLDLVDAAYAVQDDDLPQVSNWTEQHWLAPVTDDQARRWFDADATLWAVVIKPWVLVQEIHDPDAADQPTN